MLERFGIPPMDGAGIRHEWPMPVNSNHFQTDPLPAISGAQLSRRTSNTIESNTLHNVRHEAPLLCDSIVEECRKARYFYVKGLLAGGVNHEVNQDKEAVRSLLLKMSFPSQLTQSLEEVERLYRDGATPFDFKSSMGHLRSFLEQLQVDACTAAQKQLGGALVTKWGESLGYLKNNNIITAAEEQFAAKLYTLLSDAGVHPLIAEREYARMMRNVSIEYGLLLLTKLDKMGLR